MYVLNSEQIRKVEDDINKNGISFDEMMENAGVNASKEIMKKFNEKERFVVVCGKGKNAGDGFVIARELAKKLYNVFVVLALGEPSDKVSKEKLEMLQLSSVTVLDYKNETISCIQKIKSAHVIVDALFGIGFKGELDESLATLIDNINASNSYVVAVDIPSGLSSDSGEIAKACIKSDFTISMLALKPVHVLKPASYLCGEVKVVDIGQKQNIIEAHNVSFSTADFDEIKSHFKPRPYNSHKGNFGHLLIVAGSYRMPGAAVLAANAAVNTGAGLVTVAFPKSAYSAISSKLTEPLLLPLDDNKNGRLAKTAIGELLKASESANAILIGCGLGADDETEFIVKELIKSVKCPIIIDADGINIVSKNIDILKEARSEIILTPHPGEMSRLTGISIEEILFDAIYSAQRFSEKYAVTLVLKGANTIIAGKNETTYINSTGNAGMARGGSGDLLSGMIGSFLAQSFGMFDSAKCAVYLHGKAGDTISEQYSQLSATPTMLMEVLPSLLSNLN